MARKPKRVLSFFKVLIGDFTNELRMPPAFVKRFKKLMTKTCILISNMGKSSLVTLKSNEEGCYYFARGWKRFVKLHRLQDGDFLVFKFVGDRTFDVVIYDQTCCVKDKVASNTNRRVGRSRAPRRAPIRRKQEIPSKKHAHNNVGPCDWVVKTEVNFVDETIDLVGKSPANAGEESAEVGERERLAKAIRSVAPKHPYFIQVLKDYQKNHLVIPRGVARAAGLAKMNCVVIKDPKGRAWEVDIHARKGQHVYLSKGWSDFLAANRLVAGDTCVFHFQRGRFIVKIHSKRR